LAQKPYQRFFSRFSLEFRVIAVADWRENHAFGVKITPPAELASGGFA
jgi:hypothetical protein